MLLVLVDYLLVTLACEF